jgi:S1-C subfamily serine protease
MRNNEVGALSRLSLWNKAMQPRSFNVARYVTECARAIALALILAVTTTAPAWPQIPDLATGRIPTLAPLVREVTPAVVNISVQGKVREDNPLYKDPIFREFFDIPKQLEKEVSAAALGRRLPRVWSARSGVRDWVSRATKILSRQTRRLIQAIPVAR